MPLRRVVATLVGSRLVLEHLLARDRADGADLGVSNAKLGGVVQYWVCVESGR